MQSKIRIGILGAARIAPKALIDPARVMPTALLSGIAARDRSKAEAFAQKHGIAAVYDRYDALIDAPDIDLIYNPLPIDGHAAWTIRALEAGKHVLCEKPFAMNIGEAREMLAAAEASGKRLVEAFHYRYHPAFQTCLDWIADGRIGEIKTFEAAFGTTIRDNGTEIRHRPENGGGAMMDLGCYPLHWALSVMGTAPQSLTASATLTPSGVDESMEAVLTFASGAVATLRASMAEGQKLGVFLTITGTKGDIRFRNPLAPHMGASLALVTADETLTAPISRISTYTYQLAALLDALDMGEPLPTEGAMVLRQQETLDAIYEAAGLKALRWR